MPRSMLLAEVRGSQSMARLFADREGGFSVRRGQWSAAGIVAIFWRGGDYVGRE